VTVLDLLGALGRGAGGVEVGRSGGLWEEGERLLEEEDCC